ncbi:MAG TPA: hypothetical protein VEH50_03690 [Methylomirabilota bacterium]|nr:hypothetical protein [Methylomirabilota bacterium]
MILALAVLLFQPQALPQSASVAESRSISAGATTAAPPPVTPPGRPASDDVGATTSVSYQPGRLTPVPVGTISSSAASTTGADPAEPPAAGSYTRAPNMTTMMVSVAGLRAEAWRKRKIWYGLALAGHSAAGFDAWTTNHEIATGRARELDPLMRPFAGNASIYIATQVGPTILDYVGKRMMYSRHAWVRQVWWLPQALGTAGSLFSGAHNLTLHAATNP